MAKLFFTKGVDLDLTTLLRAVKTDQDADYLLGDHTITSTTIEKEISDADYDSFFNGTKDISIENNLPVFVDAQHDTRQLDEETFTAEYNRYKKALEYQISIKPNHSQITKAQACLAFLNTIDVSNLSYPTDNFEKKLKDNDTFVGLIAF